MNLGAGVHLTYCSNIHPGESWSEVRANLERYATRVKERVMPDAEFGLGLRLSARAAAELSQPETLAECRDFLARSRMYVFTLNGFPHGTFHDAPVKEAVYLPDWRDPERLRYTNQLADLLADLLPASTDMEGSVSTVPGAYKAALGDADDQASMVEHLLQHVAHLVALRERSGRIVTLALEPEPCCFLETTDEVVAFFERDLHGPAAVQRLMALGGLGHDTAAQALRTHLGVCLDLCHAAVEFERPDDVLNRLRQAGIRILKMQISAGLRLPTLDVDALDALARFQDPVYLHQVVQRTVQGLTRFADLPQALASRPAFGSDGEWRVHFHVPIFLAQLDSFESTQDFVHDMLALHRSEPVSPHLEIETYTWDVLPAAYRSGPVDAAIARELVWVRTELGL